jgi:hypothetical protein
MDVNDNAGCLVKRADLAFIASKLAPTKILNVCRPELYEQNGI